MVFGSGCLGPRKGNSNRRTTALTCHRDRPRLYVLSLSSLLRSCLAFDVHGWCGRGGERRCTCYEYDTFLLCTCCTYLLVAVVVVVVNTQIRHYSTGCCAPSLPILSQSSIFFSGQRACDLVKFHRPRSKKNHPKIVDYLRNDIRARVNRPRPHLRIEYGFIAQLPRHVALIDWLWCIKGHRRRSTLQFKYHTILRRK